MPDTPWSCGDLTWQPGVIVVAVAFFCRGHLWDGANVSGRIGHQLYCSRALRPEMGLPK